MDRARTKAKKRSRDWDNEPNETRGVKAKSDILIYKKIVQGQDGDILFRILLFNLSYQVFVEQSLCLCNVLGTQSIAVSKN